MRKVYQPILLSLAATFLMLSGCEEDVNTASLNEPPKIAVSINEEDLIGINLDNSTKPNITATAQADAGLTEVTIELLKGSGTEVLETVSTFDEVSSILYVINVLPEYSAEVTGLRIKATDREGRNVEKTLEIETYTGPVFEPMEGLVGSTVTLSGPTFVAEDIESVMLGETAVEAFSVAPDGSNLTFEVPEGAIGGAISINRAGTYPWVTANSFTVLSEAPKVLVTHTDVTVNAQGNRNDDGVVTAFSAEGEVFTLSEGLDEEKSAKIDFITTDSGGDDGLDLFSPNHDGWLPGNYFKKDESGDMTWPVLNQTKLVHLEDKDEAFFANATIEDIEALPIDDFKTRLSIGPSGEGQSLVGAVILFQKVDGKKGLLHWKGHDANATGGSKADIFTFDIKVLEQ